MDLKGMVITITFSATLSIACLLLLMVLYIRHREHQSLSGKIVLTVSVCFMLNYALDPLILLPLLTTVPNGLCHAFAILWHFSHFAKQTWITLMAYDIARTTSSMKSKSPNFPNQSSRYLKYSVFTWLIALVVSLPAVMAEYSQLIPEYYKPGFAKLVCYMTNVVGFRIFFEAPSTIILLADFILLGITVRVINRVKSISQKAEIHSQRNRFRLCIKLVLVMGVSQAAYFLHHISESIYLHFSLRIFLGLHGVFVFLIFGWKYFACLDGKNACVSCLKVKETPARTPLEESDVMPKTEPTE